MYIVDTNFFIQAYRVAYPMDVFAGFWAKVKEMAENAQIGSIDKVKNEIFRHEDDLKRWCEGHLPDGFFKDTTPILRNYISVAQWANTMSSHYTPQALAEFLHADEADAWLVAFAMTDASNKLVTHEVSQPQAKRKIKIPEVCNAKGVQFCNTVDMLRCLGVRI